MHIPNGFLDPKICAATFALSGASVALAARAVVPQLDRKKLAAMGAMTAYLLAAQSVNYSISGGTSGHLIGGVLAALLLGPAAAVLVMSSMLIVQCALFHDGGSLALGANILNMGVIAPLFGFLVSRNVQRRDLASQRRILCAAGAAWISVIASACACSLELELSGTAALGQALPAMLLHHVQIGIGEALITTGCIAALTGLRAGSEISPAKYSKSYATACALAVSGIALTFGTISPTLPDGLEATAAALHFDSLASSANASPLTGFGLLAAGLIGAAAAFVITHLGPGLFARTSLKR